MTCYDLCIICWGCCITMRTHFQYKIIHCCAGKSLRVLMLLSHISSTTRGSRALHGVLPVYAAACPPPSVSLLSAAHSSCIFPLSYFHFCDVEKAANLKCLIVCESCKVTILSTFHLSSHINGFMHLTLWWRFPQAVGELCSFRSLSVSWSVHVYLLLFCLKVIKRIHQNLSKVLKKDFR